MCELGTSSLLYPCQNCLGIFCHSFKAVVTSLIPLIKKYVRLDNFLHPSLLLSFLLLIIQSLMFTLNGFLIGAWQPSGLDY